MADHLTARQTGSGYTRFGQHALTDVSTGLTSKSAATSWTTQQSNSAINLPRCGKVGVSLIDATTAKTLECMLDNTALDPAVSGFTLECVVATKTSGFNFFGGVWEREAVTWFGSGYKVGIVLGPVNDSISDTTGRMYAQTSDSGSRVASRSTLSRPVVTDGMPHHVAITHERNVTASAIKTYVDGALTETVTTTAVLAALGADGVRVSVNDFFTGFDGSISHVCATQGVLSANEIKARANLVTNLAGRALTDQGRIMAWDASTQSWVAQVKGRNSAGGTWIKAKTANTREY